MDILLASSNEHKKGELSALLAPHVLHTPKELGFSFDCEENAPTFEGNAMIKARALMDVAKAHNVNMPVLADDSGLIVDALPNQLGVKTARFGSPDGVTVLPATEKNLLLIDTLKGVEDRSARFVCCLVLLNPDDSVIVAEGKVEGYILTQLVGTGGFGYDPVFYNLDADRAAGLLSPEEKNFYGHRGKAARLLLQKIG